MPYTKRFKDTLYSPAWLREQYLEQQRSAKDIAAELKTDAAAVIKRLKRYDIPTRSAKEASDLAPGNRGKGSSSPRPKKNRDTLHNESWLREHYVELGLDASEVARRLNCSVPVVIWALKKFGIEVRGISAAKKGKPNPARRVKDKGASKSTLMNRARECCADGPCSVCQGRSRDDHENDIQHKDRNRLKYDSENLERLCRACHRKQHAAEEQLALRVLVHGLGIPMRQIYDEARLLLLAGDGRLSDHNLGLTPDPDLQPIIQRLLAARTK